MNIKERLTKLRACMLSEVVDLCVIPTSDFHDSEYISDYFKTREYFSGFTGSAGTLVVSSKEAALFTDSRYFIQAEKELADTEIKLMKMGEEKTPSIKDYILSKISENQTVGFDSRLLSFKAGKELCDALKGKNAHIKHDFMPQIADLRDVKQIFNDVNIYGTEYSGLESKEKIKRVFEKLKEYNTDSHIITALDEIAYLMNLRGNDIECNPVFFSFMVFANSEVCLYANIDDEAIMQHINDAGVILKPYSEFYKDGLQRVKNCTKQGVLLDLSRISYYVAKELEGINIVDKMSPAFLMKSIKNEVEQENIIKANIKDGIALVKFNKWLDEAINSGEKITELSVQNKLYEYRSANDTLRGLSFETISAYGEHGAIVHYESTKETDVEITKGSFLLIDSGGQYIEGTTDITRTYAIGDVDEKLKRDYTMVLKANLKLMNTCFKHGIRGSQLDIIAKNEFWKRQRDYGHGTGHGIGCFLNVHESPVRISWAATGKITDVIFEPGMLVSDEPGFYLENEYGIRIENDILVSELEKNSYGRFLCFKAVTLCPIDTKPILWEEMDDESIGYLNEYHALVYNSLKDYFEGEELRYLEEATKELSR